MNVTFKNVEGLGRAIARGDATVIAATMTAINDVALDIAARADDLVPFDTGVLSGSQKIENATFSNLTATIGYGGPAAPYALVQHENPDYQHSAGRVYKYLEAPARQVGQDIDKRIVGLVNKAL